MPTPAAIINGAIVAATAVVPGVKYDWIEIKETGERYQFNNPDNDGCYHTAFPFDFTFYTSGLYQSGRLDQRDAVLHRRLDRRHLSHVT